MALTIGEFKQANPEYAEVDDFQLAKYLHETYYSNTPFNSFAKQVGVEDPNAPGDMSRGFSTGTEQLKQAGYGILAAAGATGEAAFGEGGLSTGLKKAGLAAYKEQEEKIAETAKPSDEATYVWERAKEGDFGALGDWLQYGIGQAGNQAIQVLATAGLGGFIAKQGVQYAGKELAAKLVESQAAKIAETEATKIAAGELTKEAIQQQATKMVADKIGNIGANTALGGMALTQEGGEIGGDLVAKAEKEGRPLTGDELAKAFVYSIGAGTAEFIGDKFGLDVLMGKTKFGKTLGGMEGIGGRVARGTAAGLSTAPKEALTEYGQTLLEEAGKGEDPFSEQARKNAINAAAAGAFGGHVMGFAGGVLTSPIMTANTADEVIANANQALNEPQKLLPQLVFDKEGNSYDKNELVRRFMDQGYDQPTANAYIEKITTPEIKSEPLSLESYNALPVRPVSMGGILAPAPKTQDEYEALQERLAIQSEGNVENKPFDINIPFSNQTRAEIADEWEQYDLANQILQEARASQKPAQPITQAIEPAAQIKPIAETAPIEQLAAPKTNAPLQQKAPTSPVEFAPTHELNDGTPVVKVEGENNVFVDQTGNEWQADDAIPLTPTQKAEAVINEPKTTTEIPRYDTGTVSTGNAPTVGISEAPATIPSTEEKVTPPQFAVGKIGGQFAAGEIVTTSSGRQTTPFPKFKTKEGNIKPVHIKAVDKWLMRNALEEAKARNDEFNARQFEANLDKPSQADKDSAEEYLFGKQPEVQKPMLKPLVAEKAEPVSAEMEDLKSQMGQAIGELASLLGGKTNLTEEEETKLIPIMSKIFRIAAKMGYVKFKDAAQHVMSQIRELAGDEVADKLSIENLQAGYINIAKEIGGDKREALQYDSIQELEGDKNAKQEQETTQPNGSRGAQPRIRQEGEDTTESREGIRDGGQEERNISQELVDVFNKLGKQGISKAGEKLIKQRSDTDIITTVQSHWLDVLADVGYEKENKSDNPNGKVFIQC